jgi:hypothetical protein
MLLLNLKTSYKRPSSQKNYNVNTDMQYLYKQYNTFEERTIWQQISLYTYIIHNIKLTFKLYFYTLLYKNYFYRFLPHKILKINSTET